MIAQRILISIAILICAGTRVSAALTACVTASCYAAAITGDGDTFSNIAFTQGNLGDSYTDTNTGVTFTDVVGMMGTANPTGWPTGTALTVNPAVTTLSISLPAAVNTIDFSVGMQDFSYFTIAVGDGSTPTYTIQTTQTGGVQNPVFFGITTTASFSTFTITSQSSVDKITLDNVQVGEMVGGGGDPAETPEVGTMLLMATGLFFMVGARKRMPGWRKLSGSSPAAVPGAAAALCGLQSKLAADSSRNHSAVSVNEAICTG